MQRNLYINYQKKTRENQNQATPRFWAGVLQDCDTEEQQADAEAVLRDLCSWKEVSHCSHSLCRIKRRLLVQEGALCSLKVQTRPSDVARQDLWCLAQSCPLPCRTLGLPGGNSGNPSDWPTSDAPALPVLLLLLAKGQGHVLPGLCTRLHPQCTVAGCSQGAPVAFHSPLPSQYRTRAFPITSANETQSPPSCVHSFLSFKALSLLQGLCESWTYVFAGE